MLESSHSAGRALAGMLALCVASGIGAASCGNDVVVEFPGGGSDASGGAGGVAGGGPGGGPVGGSGGDPGCGNCAEPTPICIDDECVAACPAGQQACNPQPNDSTICCAPAEQCCGALSNGYPADCDPYSTHRWCGYQPR